MVGHGQRINKNIKGKIKYIDKSWPVQDQGKGLEWLLDQSDFTNILVKSKS